MVKEWDNLKYEIDDGKMFCLRLRTFVWVLDSFDYFNKTSETSKNKKFGTLIFNLDLNAASQSESKILTYHLIYSKLTIVVPSWSYNFFKKT